LLKKFKSDQEYQGEDGGRTGGGDRMSRSKLIKDYFTNAYPCRKKGPGCRSSPVLNPISYENPPTKIYKIRIGAYTLKWVFLCYTT
jgi:hypothetical protein